MTTLPQHIDDRGITLEAVAALLSSHMQDHLAIRVADLTARVAELEAQLRATEEAEAHAVQYVARLEKRLGLAGARAWDECNSEAWHAGYDAGVAAERAATLTELGISESLISTVSGLMAVQAALEAVR